MNILCKIGLHDWELIFRDHDECKGKPIRVFPLIMDRVCVRPGCGKIKRNYGNIEGKRKRQQEREKITRSAMTSAHLY